MKTDIETWTVKKLVDAFVSGQLLPNSALKLPPITGDDEWHLNLQDKHDIVEAWFQRPVVWGDEQMRMFLDSVLREYRMPLIYLRELPGAKGYEIIDGQQRINALYGFKTGAPVVVRFETTKVRNSLNLVIRKEPIKPLLDPYKNKKFPDFLRKDKCPFAGMLFHSNDPKKCLPPEYQKLFLQTPVSVAVMKNASDDEVVDMFIRLQGGAALSAQEKRDALPGDLCNYVRQIGGKYPSEWPKHPFIKKFARTPAKDRGEVRQLVAQIFALFLSRRSDGDDLFCSIGDPALYDCYRAHTRIDTDVVEKFVQVLDNQHELLADNIGKLTNPNVTHLVLLADMLEGGFEQWENGMVDALSEWLDMLHAATHFIDGHGASAPTPNHLATATDFLNLEKPSAEEIRKRHMVYARQMLLLLGDDLQPDPPLADGWTDALEEAAYYMESGICHRCEEEVTFKEKHFEQVTGHAKDLFYENWALVHKKCVPYA